MSDPIGPFGQEQIAAGAKAIHGGHGCTCRLGARGDATAAISAAVSALDREALIQLVRGVHYEVPYAAPRRWENPLAKREHAAAVIEAIFPEGKAPDASV